MNKHIILIGFKHTGKSSVGIELAKKLKIPFIDLDKKIEENYHHVYNKIANCRQITETHGEKFFRELEYIELKNNLLNNPPAIIATGGGAPLSEKNQLLILPHKIIHIIAQPNIVFARIMKNGTPAFFPENEDPTHAFTRLWQERTEIYQRLAQYTIDNSDTLSSTVHQIIKELSS